MRSARLPVSGSIRPILRAATVCLTAFVALGPARGAEVTFAFEGEVVTVGDLLIPAGFAVGEPIEGWYAFDSELPDFEPSDPTAGRYAPLAGMFFSIGLTGDPYLGVIGSGTSDIVVYDDVPDSPILDRYIVTLRDPDGDPVEGMAPSSFALQLTDPTATAFASDALPLDPPPLSDFTVENTNTSFITLNFGIAPGTAAQVRGRVTSLTRMPEPTTASAGLAAAGVLGGALALRRRARSRSASPR